MQKKAWPGSDMFGYIHRERGGAGWGDTKATVDAMNFYPIALCRM